MTEVDTIVFPVGGAQSKQQCVGDDDLESSTPRQAGPSGIVELMTQQSAAAAGIVLEPPSRSSNASKRNVSAKNQQKGKKQTFKKFQFSRDLQ